MRFLDRYVDADGRVVRRDQGGDSVSEGQAYAMLLALAARDDARFRRVWGWTQRHLQREDGLFSWHWVDGRIVDPQPAADADLGIAWALAIAAERFGTPSYRDEAVRIAQSIVSDETATVAGRRVLAAGPWARSDRVVNPSYFAPRAFALLAETTGDSAWKEIGESAVRILTALTSRAPHLPPDWAIVDARGEPRPTGAPGTSDPPRYGYDAIRVALWTSSSCSESERRISAATWPFYKRAGTKIAPVYTLEGEPFGPGRSAGAHVAAAAAARSAGDEPASDRLMAEAEAIDGDTPTYYGAALVALGRTLMTSSLLGSCTL